MTGANCTCPDCLTEDFRAIDEICTHPDCRWGDVDPACPQHGERAVEATLAQ